MPPGQAMFTVVGYLCFSMISARSERSLLPPEITKQTLSFGLTLRLRSSAAATTIEEDGSAASFASESIVHIASLMLVSFTDTRSSTSFSMMLKFSGSASSVRVQSAIVCPTLSSYSGFPSLRLML